MGSSTQSGSSAAMMTLDQWNNRSWSSCGKPTRSAMAFSGSLWVTSSTKSPLDFSAARGDDLAGGRRQTLLERGHAARREEPRDQFAQPRVHRRVRIVHQELGRLQLLGGDVGGIPHDTALAISRPHLGGAG